MTKVVNCLKGNSRLDRIPISPYGRGLTGRGDSQNPESTIHKRQRQYTPDAVSAKAVDTSLVRVLEYHATQKAAKPVVGIDRQGIIGTSCRLNQALDLLAQAVGSEAGVLISGESGTGKRLFARAVHRNSAHRNHHFIVVACPALSDPVAQIRHSERIKTVFSWANAPGCGLFDQADGGTLFLEEIDEMPLQTQESLLGLLASHTWRRKGSSRAYVCKFRLISSSKGNLEDMVRQGRFRKDLFQRLRAFHLKLPPLRERKEDLAALAVFHGNRLNELYGWRAKRLAQGFLQSLHFYDWPGNVCELVTVLDYAVMAARFDESLFPCHLPGSLRKALAGAGQTQSCLPIAPELNADRQDYPAAQAMAPHRFNRARA